MSGLSVSDVSEQSPEQTIAALLRIQAGFCKQIGSPLYAALLERAAEDVERHGPTWEVLQGHEGDPAESALALRLMGAVNRLVLAGREPALAVLYEDREPNQDEAWRAFAAALERNAAELRRLVELPVQTNEVGRCAALLHGFLTVAAETGMPLRLLEVGASAGLNLRWDRYRYRAREFAWGPPASPVTIEFELAGAGRLPAAPAVEIAERHGCDTAPVDPGTPEGRQTLLAYLWPDQPARADRLRGALALAARLPVTVDREGAASWVERRLAQKARGQATVLFHSIVAQYMGEEERDAFHGHLEEAGRCATVDAPLAWLRMEPAGERADLRLTTWPPAEEHLLARVGYHGSPVELVRRSPA